MTEISYEMTELFLNPKYLVSSYLSASLINSQTKPENKFLVRVNDEYIKKMIPDLKKSYVLQRNICNLYNII